VGGLFYLLLFHKVLDFRINLCYYLRVVREERKKKMTNQELREALRLLLQVWEEHGQEGCEALLAAVREEN
jgi:hypothetical protein